MHVFEKFLITCKLFNYIFFFQFSVSTICLSFNCRCYGDVHQVVLWRPKQRQRYPSQFCTSSDLCSTLRRAVLGYFYCRYVFLCVFSLIFIYLFALFQLSVLLVVVIAVNGSVCLFYLLLRLNLLIVFVDLNNI